MSIRGIHNNSARFCIFAALALLAIGVDVPRARATWLFSYPPNMVKFDSGKRNNVFYVGDTISFTVAISNYGTYKLQGNVTYDVHDYFGNLVDSGTMSAPTPTSSSTLAVHATVPGWYKVNVHEPTAVAPWGDSIGSVMFVIFRNTAGFPTEPSENLPNNSGAFDGDEVARGVTQMGPQRHPVEDASNPNAVIQELDYSIGQDEQYYTPFDPVRGRPLLLEFPNGVGSSNATQQAANLAGLSQLVSHYHTQVKYWEPLNEPNGTYDGGDYVNKELKPFYTTVKGIDPSCKVLAPAVVTIGPYGLNWIDEFLKAGGAKYMDAFSFHAYNNVNGDPVLVHESFNALNTELAKYGLQNIEKWQTEQGYFAACYGAYEPRLQGRWTMLQMLTFEQNGIPKEHNDLWYDKSHGDWDFPAFWENEDGNYSYGSFDPAAALMRVWSEELYGTTYSKGLNFGALGNKMYLGDVFIGPNKRLAAIMSAGRTDGQVTLQVHGGGATLHTVSAFGVATDLPVVAGLATLPVTELPVYVELAAGQSFLVAPIDFGPDLALTPGTTALTSGDGLSPLNPAYPNSITKIINGVLENWYWAQGPGDHPWMDDTPGFPAWVEVDLPKAVPVSHVVIYSGVPWQSDGSLLDYTLEYEEGGTWVPISHVVEPTNVTNFFTPTVFTTVDSYYSDRCIFEHDFSAVTTQKIRLVVNDCTWGGGATAAVVQAGGQTGTHHFELREIEIYGPSGAAPQYHRNKPGHPVVKKHASSKNPLQ